MKHLRAILTILFLITLMAGPAWAQEEEKDQDKAEKPATEEKEEKGKEEKKKSKFKDYDEVITEEAKTREGVFITHRVDNKLYYEIPAGQFGREFLWVAQFSKTQRGAGYGGMPIGNTVVRWERHDDTVLLREVDYQKRAEPGSPVSIAVEASSLEKVLASFKIAAFKDEEKTIAVVDVTPLFMGDPDDFSPKAALNAVAFDPSRSFIESVKAFPQNIEVRVLSTYKLKPNASGSGGSVSVELHHSMVALPEDKMMPRLSDKRVGYFSAGFEDYSTTNDEIDPIRYISRWRLEKKDPDAELSEPVEPIVYYVGRGVPERYRQYVKDGIEMWQPAFEQAGFKNAIIAKDPPSIEEDPDWDAEDARYSVIRWLPSTVQNAFGPHIRDPRTGEILEADVRMFHNVIKIARNWYFTRAGAADPRAHKLPFPEDLQGELIRYVAAHEVGHTLGLRHNHKSSANYTVEQLRDPEFTSKYGYMGSIMDYSRFNYVAQPGDGAMLGVDMVFPYDKFAIEWGYKQFPGTTTPEEDKPYLNEIAARQLEDPRLVFGSYEEGPDGIADPFSNSSDQTGEPIKASTMGMKNLERITGYLYDATTNENDDFDLLEEMHAQVVGQYFTYMSNVAKMIGSIEYNKKVAGQPGAVFVPFSPDRQREALAYLHKNAFMINDWLLPDGIIELTGMEGITSTVSNRYRQLLAGMLLSDRVLNRMVDMEATSEDVYPVAEYLSDLSGGIFAELKQGDASINVMRRNLQTIYVEQLVSKLESDNTRGDIKALMRGTLSGIADDLENASSGDTATRYHLDYLNAVIEEALSTD